MNKQPFWRQVGATMLFCLVLGSGSVNAADDGITVLTTLPATYSVTAALAEGTQIQVVNIPDKGRRLSALPAYFDSQAAQLRATLAGADAVVTIGKLWNADPLYTAARAANIRVVNIDASKPWSTTLSGVTVAAQPPSDAPWGPGDSESVSTDPAVCFWLSLTNGTRMAEIIAADLQALAPADAGRIRTNLDALNRELRTLKSEYESKLAAVADVSLYALANDFVYLTGDLGLYVDGYFLKQDIRWTPEDLRGLTAYLKAHGVGVVLHKWDPSPAIKAAIADAGARLVILQLGDGPVGTAGITKSGYQDLLRANMEALHAALGNL